MCSFLPGVSVRFGLHAILQQMISTFNKFVLEYTCCESGFELQMDHLLINLLTLVLLWHPAHGSRRETELCYIKGLPINTNVCRTPTNVLCCHEVPTDINVTVYRGANCNSPSQCGPRSEGCCSKSTKINITKEYSNALKLSFISTKCFSEVNSGNIVSSSMPNNTGLDLVVVSFNCPETTTTSPTALPPTRETTITSPTALPPTRDSHETTTIAVSITCSVIIILLAAIVTGICVYRRRVNTGATTQVSDRMPQSNNIYSQEPIAENNDNVVPPTYEQLLRQTNEGEYSQIIGHTAAAQTPEPGTGDPHSGQGRIYVNIEETT